MSDLTPEQKWPALLRGQIMVSTVGKFMTVISLLDQKAQVMIFINSILIPVCISAVEHETFKEAAIVSVFTAILSIFAAIICIYPKRKYRNIEDSDLNLLHFNDIGHLELEQFVPMFLERFNDGEKLCEMAVYDLHDLSSKSIRPKYTWLKISYAIFLIGNVLAVLIAILAS